LPAAFFATRSLILLFWARVLGIQTPITKIQYPYIKNLLLSCAVFGNSLLTGGLQWVVSDADEIKDIPSEDGRAALQRLAGLLRARRGDLSVRTVARQMRMSPKTYRLIEAGRARPHIHTCYQLAGFLGFLPEEVIALAGYPVHGS
jgi:DNA-binding XRE family transcriptional regulator